MNNTVALFVFFQWISVVFFVFFTYYMMKKTNDYCDTQIDRLLDLNKLLNKRLNNLRNIIDNQEQIIEIIANHKPEGNEK